MLLYDTFMSVFGHPEELEGQELNHIGLTAQLFTVKGKMIIY